MKILKLIISLLVVSMLLSGCEKNSAQSGEGENGELDHTVGELTYYGLGACDSIQNNMISYYSATNVFDMDNASIELYFGHYYSEYAQAEDKAPYSNVTLTVKRDGSNDEGLIKAIDGDYNSELYRFIYSTDDFFDRYTHHETVKIPKKFFTSNIGVISISLVGIPDGSETQDVERISACSLAYRKLDNRKVLFGTSVHDVQGDEVFRASALRGEAEDLGIRISSDTVKDAYLTLTSDKAFFTPDGVSVNLNVKAKKSIFDEGVSLLLIENAPSYDIWMDSLTPTRTVTVLTEFDTPFTKEKYSDYYCTVDIPEETFVRDSGYFELRVGAPSTKDSVGYSTIGSVRVYYARVGNEILLGASPHDLIY